MKRVVLPLFFLIFINASAQLKINEIMSNNVSAVLDDTYNYSMWVELYNTSTTSSINQSSYFFTDNLLQPRKWKPVSKLITPGGYGVLWFERDDRTGHANFKLDPDGGKLFLCNIFGQLLDSVVYPAQKRNVSYGRKTDGSSEWVFFEQFSAGNSNNNKVFSFERCAKPVFKLPGGFYASTQDISFETPNPGETIYYTINGAEPTQTNANIYTPGAIITLRYTNVFRAKSFSTGKLSSEIATASYFIAERNFHLPVVSIVTSQANLTDNTIGMYVTGTNGITGNGSNSPVNFNQDWDRPVNFELFDSSKVLRINQELDITISGGWSRMNPQKSLKISPRKKFGNNRLRYDFFGATKPDLKYKNIQLRNSGNDFYYSMMRDAFMQSVVMKRMDLDYLAYEPAVLYLNGIYYGIQNLRETSGNDFLYSNYGLEEEAVHLVETWAIPTDTSYLRLSNYITQNDITQASVYNKVCGMMDVDNFINYTISQVYYGNTDWPANNVKIWKLKTGGKWRWILFDTDFGFNLYDANLHNHNSLLYALGEKTDQVPEAWSTLLLRRLVLNETFRNRFIDRFSVQLSTTFETGRVNHIMDSLSAKIVNEIAYHKTRWTSYRGFAEDIQLMKVFSANRAGNMLSFLSSRFAGSATIVSAQLTSNIPSASYRMNSEPVIGSNVLLKYFKNRPISIEAKPVAGYKFKQWELSASSTPSTIVGMGSPWKYFDGNAIPALNWFAQTYSDVAWKSGPAQLGYGSKGEKTLISYGDNASNKYPTSYFRKIFTLSDLNGKTNFSLTILVDDGAAVYVNGQEVGRYMLPTGTLTFNTLATAYNNGDLVTYAVPLSLLKAGDNLIAVEVHQTSVISSDVMFDLQLTCQSTQVSEVVSTNPIYSGALSGNVSLKAVYETAVIENQDDLPPVVINELVASNDLISDEFGGKDDYIELYNNGDVDVNVAGWYLSDTPANKTLAQIPSTDETKTTIPAKGRLILWADDQAMQGVLHLGFKLGKEGESVILSKTNSLGMVVTVDSVSFPFMDANLSFSRVPDGVANWMVRKTTFNVSNGDITAVELPQSNINVYPTLVRESLNVQNAAGDLLTITDLTGKVLYRNRCQSAMETVQVGFLQQGLYVVTVGNRTYKIVKL